MCRACSDPSGGRRCPKTETSVAAGKAASRRYYARSKARLLIAQLHDHGIRALDDTEVPPTFHAVKAGTHLDLENPPALKNVSRGIDKPQGALWSAVGRQQADGTAQSSWTDWAAREGRDTPESLHVVRPQPGAVIVYVGNSNDAKALMGRYSTPGEKGPRFDWAAMRRDGIDGVYVTEGMARPNPSDTSPSGNFHGWDVPSIAWLSNDNLTTDSATVECGQYETIIHDDGEHGTTSEVKADGMGTYNAPLQPAFSDPWDRVPEKAKALRTEGLSEHPSEETPESANGPKAPGTKKVRPPKEPTIRPPKERAEKIGPDRSLMDSGKQTLDYLRALLDEPEKKNDD